MKSIRLCIIVALSPILVLAAAAQTPPPSPPPPASDRPQMQGPSPATHSSRINAVIYGPRGEVQALTLRNGVAVTVTPDIGARLTSNAIKGTRVRVSGMESVIAGQTSLAAQSLTANGQTFIAAPAPPQARPEMPAGTPPPPPARRLQPGRPGDRRSPGAPPLPPPNGAAPPPHAPGAGAPPPAPPDEATPAPPPAGANPDPPPQM